MFVSEILRRLPASLKWAVLFNLASVRRCADDITVNRMFFLPENLNIDLYSHVVLTSEGPVMVDSQMSALVNPYGSAHAQVTLPVSSLHERFLEELALIPLENSDCLGVGERCPFPPVLLHVRMDMMGRGEAIAVFQDSPAQRDYLLLRAVGVEFLNSEQRGRHHLARFRIDLPTHIYAGKLANFARAGHCTRFFLGQGSIDAELEHGLVGAATDRLDRGWLEASRALSELANEACRDHLTLICQPPPPAKRFPWGDIVPLGFLLKALSVDRATIPGWQQIREEVHRILLSKRQGLLWSYHSGGLVTSTDSVLVLQAFDDPAAVEALEVFGDGLGRYHPQLSSHRRDEPGKMLVGHANGHWCQPDYPTTCLVRGLRERVGLTTKTSTDYLISGFGTRSGLYFANPYMIDWALACALIGDTSARDLKERLATEVMASMNDDYSFGFFDVPLSSAFAILTLAVLGLGGRQLRIAQLRLLESMQRDGTFPPSTPFYSSLAIHSGPTPTDLQSGDPCRRLPPQVLGINGELHALSLYNDVHKLISTPVAVLALAVDTSANEYELTPPSLSACHPRYLCGDHAEYIQNYALPPYLHREGQSAR